jgi:hypothetical protein
VFLQYGICLEVFLQYGICLEVFLQYGICLEVFLQYGICLEVFLQYGICLLFIFLYVFGGVPTVWYLFAVHFCIGVWRCSYSMVFVCCSFLYRSLEVFLQYCICLLFIFV